MARQPKKISEFDRKLGIAIRHLRTDPETGMSQATLARATGIPLSNLQRREDGDNEVTVSELERIAVALNTTSLAIVEDALKRYGGIEKLIAEHAVSVVAPTVEDSIPYIGRIETAPERIAANKDERTDPEE